MSNELMVKTPVQETTGPNGNDPTGKTPITPDPFLVALLKVVEAAVVITVESSAPELPVQLSPGTVEQPATARRGRVRYSFD